MRSKFIDRAAQPEPLSLRELDTIVIPLSTPGSGSTVDMMRAEFESHFLPFEKRFWFTQLSSCIVSVNKSPSPAIIFETFDGTANRCELRQSLYDCQVFNVSRLYRNKGSILSDRRKKLIKL